MDQKSGIDMADLHDINMLPVPIVGDPEGHLLFLAYASASIEQLDKLRAYVAANVKTIDTGKAQLAFRRAQVSV